MNYLFDPKIKASTDLIIATPEFQACLQEFPALAEYKIARIVVGYGLSLRKHLVRGHCLTIHKFLQIFPLWISGTEAPACPFIHPDHLKASHLLELLSQRLGQEALYPYRENKMRRGHVYLVDDSSCHLRTQLEYVRSNILAHPSDSHKLHVISTDISTLNYFSSLKQEDVFRPEIRLIANYPFLVEGEWFDDSRTAMSYVDMLDEHIANCHGLFLNIISLDDASLHAKICRDAYLIAKLSNTYLESCQQPTVQNTAKILEGQEELHPFSSQLGDLWLSFDETYKRSINITPRHKKQIFCKYLDYIKGIFEFKSSNQTFRLAVKDGFKYIQPRIVGNEEILSIIYEEEDLVRDPRISNLHAPSLPPRAREFIHNRSINVAGQSYSHGFRVRAASSTMDTIIDIIHAQQPGEVIRWLDIGCGAGEIVNNVLSGRKDDLLLEAIGVDFSGFAIEAANHTAKGNNSSFLCCDCFKIPSSIQREGFHVVSMFELLEHLDDPAAFINSCLSFSGTYFVAGSPHKEPIGIFSKEHTYSFTEDGYASLFSDCGLEIKLLNVMKVGSFCNNHDWITCIASIPGVNLPDVAGEFQRL